jgi:hypothetical protein
VALCWDGLVRAGVDEGATAKGRSCCCDPQSHMRIARFLYCMDRLVSELALRMIPSQGPGKNDYDV